MPVPSPFGKKRGLIPRPFARWFQQQPQLSLPQPLSQPQPQLLLQPQLLPPQPPQANRMMMSRMIHRQPLPPQPLFPQHICFHTSLKSRRDGVSRAFCTILWRSLVPGDKDPEKFY